MVQYLDRFAHLVGSGHVLELGSGPGWDALHLEARGLRVTRSDATPAFLTLLRAAGHEARVLDVRIDDLGGPYDGILADAILLHLDRPQLDDVVVRARDAVLDNGILGFTVKEGDGDGWTTAKLGRPRHFTYWRELGLRDALTRAGWTVDRLDHIAGRHEPLALRPRTCSCRSPDLTTGPPVSSTPPRRGWRATCLRRSRDRPWPARWERASGRPPRAITDRSSDGEAQGP